MDDMIDFPCSDDWLEWYHRRGLTPRRPTRDDLLLELIREIRELKKLLSECRRYEREERKIEL